MNAKFLEEELYAAVKSDAVVFDFLQNTSLDGLWYLDLQAPGHEWVNAKFWQTLGYGPAPRPAGPAPWRGAMHPDDRAAAEQQLAACRQEPARPFDQVARYRHRDGSTVWLHGQGLVVRAAAGGPTRLVGALRNVTPEKQEGARAREVARHYGALLSNQSVYIIKTDPQGNYTYANDFFLARFGFDAAIIGTPSMRGVVAEDHPKCLAVALRCLAEPGVPHQLILRKPYPDGTVKSNHWEFKGIGGARGEAVEILCVGYDVTPLVENLRHSQRLLEVTRQQNARLQNFAYIVSHNIRSHSANLTSLVQLLAEAADEPQRGLFTAMLQASTEKLAETLVDLSGLAALGTDDGRHPPEPRLLAAAITKTLGALSAQIREHGAAVVVDVPADLAVPVVPAYLDSILLNLIGNAVRYRAPERPPVIRVRTRAAPGYTVLAVQDNGLGIDLAKNRDKLFGLYKTFHGNADARGIGLFTTKNQVEAMQGKIMVYSEVGAGSTFEIYFYDNL